MNNGRGSSEEEEQYYMGENRQNEGMWKRGDFIQRE